MYKPLPEPTLKEWLYALIGKRKRMRVTGDSMLPNLKAGDLVLIDTKAYKNEPPKINDVLVLWHPTKQNLAIIKRLTAKNQKDELYVLSDNPQGQDSRHYGHITKDQVIGKATSHSSLTNIAN